MTTYTDEEVRDAVATVPYWYHRIELPQCTTPGWAPIDRDAYQVPDDLKGKRVLDVGSWDGYWTWEALRRGASYVVAIDDFSDTLGKDGLTRDSQWRTWDLCQKAFGYKHCQRLTMSVYEICRLGMEFDVIFCFGVLYHLKHPMWALEKLAKCATPAAQIHIETAILDGVCSPYTGNAPDSKAVYAEVYPGNQYGMNHSNWTVPTLACVRAWLECTGWRCEEIWKLTPHPLNLSQCRGFARGVVRQEKAS